jgi:hypothetical protein
MEVTMSPQATGGLATIVAAMHGTPAVPEGWDAVLNLSESAVQSLVQNRCTGAAQARSDCPTLWWAAPQASAAHDVVQVRGDLPAPTVRLSVADQGIHISFALDSGTVQSAKVSAVPVWRRSATRSVLDVGQVTWSAPVAVTQQEPLQVSGLIPLTVAVANDGRSFSIGLKPVGGSLTLSSPKGGLLGQAVMQDLAGPLATQNLSAPLGTLALRNVNEATVLSPANVAARIASTTNGKPVLQILTGSGAGAVVPAVGTPVPHPDVHDFSLMVSSKAAMTMIANSYNLGTGDIKLACVPPQDGQVHWCAQAHEPMVFEGTFGNQNGEVYAKDYAKLFMGFGGSPDGGLQLVTSVDPSSTVRLQLDLAAHYPIGICGTGADQVVALQEGVQSVAASGFYEALVKPQLEAFLCGDIKTDMAKVRMTAVSDFALRDLTLSGHALQFEVAALPAELIVAGRLIPNA